MINHQSIKSQSSPRTQAYDDLIVDKVYTFYSGKNTVNLTNLNFEKGINYKFKIGVVTDGHSCHMEVNLIDPENDLYAIYTTNTTDGNRLSFKDYRTIPFGIAVSGIYTINFTKLDGPNMNIHLQILEDEQCIQKITDPSAIIRTEISKFSKQAGGNNDIIYHYLQEQRMYQIFIARISATRGDQLTNISIEHTLRDAADPHTLFNISLPPHLGDVYSAISYSFGTATAGEYKFSFTYDQPMNHTNIIVIIADKYLIASGEEAQPPENTTEPDPEPTPQIYVSIPSEIQLGLGLGIGVIIFLGLGLIGYAKLKNVV